MVPAKTLAIVRTRTVLRFFFLAALRVLLAIVHAEADDRQSYYYYYYALSIYFKINGLISNK